MVGGWPSLSQVGSKGEEGSSSHNVSLLLYPSSLDPRPHSVPDPSTSRKPSLLLYGFQNVKTCVWLNSVLLCSRINLCASDFKGAQHSGKDHIRILAVLLCNLGKSFILSELAFLIHTVGLIIPPLKDSMCQAYGVCSVSELFFPLKLVSLENQTKVSRVSPETSFLELLDRSDRVG